MVSELPRVMNSIQKSLKPQGANEKIFSILEKDEVHRIRINSPYICDAFAAIMGKSNAPEAGEIHLRPFKVILAYHQDLRESLAQIEQRLDTSALTAQNFDADKSPEENKFGDTRISTEMSDDAQLDEHREHNLTISQHLKAFLGFVDQHLASEIASYQNLRECNVSDGSQKISFADLWNVYAPGDVIYRPATQQAYRIVAVRGGRKPLRFRDGTEDRGYHGEGKMSAFVISCFYLDFDGELFGHVQGEICIDPYENTRLVMKLPAYPIAYLELADWVPGDILQDGLATSRQDAITKRSTIFCNLAKLPATTNKVAHKDYEGMSADEESQEHIDSEIIVDLEKFYQVQHDQKPYLGLIDYKDFDYAEVEETWLRPCDTNDPTCREQSEVTSKLYWDWKVDQQRNSTALSKIPEIERYRTANEDVLRDNHAILFPHKIYAFVLKTREWHSLAIDNISDLHHDRQNFDDLVLQDEHKEIVRSLVQMHSGGPMEVEGSTAPKATRRSNISEDLVRGKGKGVIILLHGVPGVGKTSTAECVAQYTGRPLYALTCGDIGETPSSVQSNLQKAFTLAYRWSCVLLLDEADVFLAERNRADMNRNAVVSVFLRTLEYYSGILFLTTNKVGVFDEAFKSRIHVSLYYKLLSLKQSVKIWRANLKRIKQLKLELEFDESDIIEWVKESWRLCPQDERNPWNGRQLHNAVRTAAALAAFKAENKNRLLVKHFKQVEKASQEFDHYLEETRGHDDLSHAHHIQDRADPRKADLYQRMPTRNSTRRSRGLHENYGSIPGLEFPSSDRSRLSTPKQAARQGRNNKQGSARDDDEDEDEDEDTCNRRRRQRSTSGRTHKPKNANAGADRDDDDEELSEDD